MTVVARLTVGLDARSTPRIASSTRPSLSWRVETPTDNWRQVAYEIATDRATSGRIESSESAHVPWPFSALTPRESTHVRVRVWGSEGTEPTPWSEQVNIIGGLAPSNWVGRMIGPVERQGVARPGPGYLLRRAFELPEAPLRALLHVSGHGTFEARVNGAASSDDVLAPGWTSYPHRLRYRTYDVSSLLRKGSNVVGIELSDGWYRGLIGFAGGRTDYYGDQIGAVAQLEIEMPGTPPITIATDASWRSATGPIVSTGLYEGEHHDARLERPGWDGPGFDDGGWEPAAILPFDVSVLEAPYGPPVRRIEVIDPSSVERRANALRYDFGQNASGRLRVTARGAVGATFTVRHAEVIEHGELGVRPLRNATATDTYVFGGDDSVRQIEWEPKFTIHGFRYAEITFGPDVEIISAQMIVIHSDMERSGWFECSDPLIDRLHENVVWSMKGNFVDLPTDCPQRDERLGWTGDIQVFSPTATFLFDCHAFLRSWLADLAHEQRALGTVPFYVPWIELLFPSAPTCAWGDAAVLVPEALFARYADPAVLTDQYESMTTWVRQVASIAATNGRWDTGFQFGDWLDPAAPPTNPASARTDPSLCATAYLYRSARTLAGFGALLGRHDDAAELAALAERTRAAFLHEYVTPGGRMASDAQTACAVAIVFGLLEGEALAACGRRLAALVEAEQFTIGTGFIGTPLVCDALQQTGHLDVAYQLLNQRTCPSWLYPVTMGATSIWERWDSMLADGSINPGEMTSFNHYALGAVADWLHRSVAGLGFAEPGGKVLRFAPRPGGGLTYAAARHLTCYGEASVRWDRDGEQLRVEVTVPPNSTAVIDLPGDDATRMVGSGTHRFTTSCRSAADDPEIEAVNPFEKAIAEHRRRQAEGSDR